MSLTLVDFARDRGLDDRRCFEGTALNRAMLHRPPAEIEEEHELTLVRNIVRHLGTDPCLGLEAGRRVHATTYGVLGLGLISSASVRAALALAARNVELCLTLSRLRFDEQHGAHVAEFDDGRLPADLRPFLFARDVTIYTQFFAECVGSDLRAARITCRLPSPPPNVVDRCTAVFGVRPEFGHTANQVFLRSRDLSRPMPQAHRQTAELAERLCRDVIRGRCADGGVAGQVRAVLRGAGGRLLAQEEVAGSLAMSTRSLRKHLMDEGTSYGRLVHEVTMEEAREMLATGVNVQETTWRLGYSDPAAFSRAFKHWTGSRPGAYARAALGTATQG